MNLTKNLNAFNRRMVAELQGTFVSNVEPFESEDGTLLFRGPVEGHENPDHIGTHVAISLDKDVRAALESASSEKREEITQIYLSNLGTQVKMQYNPKKIGAYALDVLGSMRVLQG